MSKANTSKTFKDKAKAAASKVAAIGEDINLSAYTTSSEEHPYLTDPSQLSAKAKEQMLDAGENVLLLDLRSPAEYQEFRIEPSTLIPLGALRDRVKEVPRDKPVIAFCKSSLRAYEAARILHGHGHTNVKVMDGGLALWPYELIQGAGV